MKIYKSNYRSHWISGLTIIERIFFWTEWSRQGRIHLVVEDKDFVEPPEWAYRWADRLEPVSNAIKWILDLVHPQINLVHIDRWDTWSMDHTLSDIILPMLKQLKETKHGSPFVDDEDVPEYLRSHMAQPKEYEWDTDSLHHQRWEWVLAEMIFAFEMKCKDDWASEFHSGEHDIKWVPVDKDGNEVAKGEHRFYEMRKGPNDTHTVDMEGMQKVQARITNGFRLFGKYYENLWD